MTQLLAKKVKNLDAASCKESEAYSMIASSIGDKKSRILKIRHNVLWIAVGITGGIFSLGYFFYFGVSSTTEKSPASLVVNVSNLSEQEIANLPIRLTIPVINVDSHVESAGLSSDGSMDTPKGPNDVAWFNLGQPPGEIGSAVITGHSGVWENGEETVFNNLHKLRKDDKLYIEDEKGVVTTFVVRESRKYDPQADTFEVFSSNDGKSHLNLITCVGVWDKASKSYSDRLVIFADKV